MKHIMLIENTNIFRAKSTVCLCLTDSSVKHQHSRCNIVSELREKLLNEDNCLVIDNSGLSELFVSIPLFLIVQLPKLAV